MIRYWLCLLCCCRILHHFAYYFVTDSLANSVGFQLEFCTVPQRNKDADKTKGKIQILLHTYRIKSKEGPEQCAEAGNMPFNMELNGTD